MMNKTIITQYTTNATDKADVGLLAMSYNASEQTLRHNFYKTKFGNASISTTQKNVAIVYQAINFKQQMRLLLIRFYMIISIVKAVDQFIFKQRKKMTQFFTCR